jgi:hypothetical protein
VNATSARGHRGSRRGLATAAVLFIAMGTACHDAVGPRPFGGGAAVPLRSEPARRRITVAAAGDICGQLPASCRPTARLVRWVSPSAVLALGDNQYASGSLEEYRASYDRAWGRFKAITYPVAGNHEWKTPNAQGFRDYFGLRSTWYAFGLGAWRMIALDGTCSAIGGCGPGSREYAWLKNELASHPAHCTLAFWHEPRFSSGTTHGSATNVGPLWDLLYAAHAELALAGHEHNYERFRPQDPSGQRTSDGIVEIVAGTGGRDEGGYPFGTPIANSLVRLSGIGVLRLRLSPSGWTERFLRPGGSTADSSSGRCH